MHIRETALNPVNMFLALGFTVAVSGCGPSDSEFKAFSTYESPGGDYTVSIDYAHSRFAFGPETIRVFVIPKGSQARNHIVTTTISNDGGITADNIKARWTGKYQIKFCLSGVEQEDRVLEIDIPEHSFSEVKEKCVNSFDS